MEDGSKAALSGPPKKKRQLSKPTSTKIDSQAQSPSEQPASSVTPIADDSTEGLSLQATYTIEVGSKIFRLSGASLSFDGPSYFTSYFSKKENQGTRLIIDRSSEIFEKIHMHLQGYSISIDNGFEFFHLYADACYFSLNKLKQKILQGDIYFIVSGTSFRIAKELLVQEGNYPNYFTITFNTILIDPTQIIRNSLRPPPVEPPFTSLRSAKLFSEILELLKGNNLKIDNEQHRDDLIAECRYYRFMRLEQQILKHRIQMNPFTRDEEIVMNLKDLKKMGIINPLVQNPDLINEKKTNVLLKYSRPYVDSNIERTLILQIESSDVSLLLNPALNFVSLVCYGKTAKKLNTILSQVGDHLIYEESEHGPKLTVVVELGNSKAVMNGFELEKDWHKLMMARTEEDKEAAKVMDPNMSPLEKIASKGGNIRPPRILDFKILKSQWTIAVDGSKYFFNALMLEGVTDESCYRKHTSYL